MTSRSIFSSVLSVSFLVGVAGCVVNEHEGYVDHIAPIHGANMLIRPGANQGFCTDAEGDKAAGGTLVNLHQCHGRQNQRWTLTDAGEGHNTIQGIGGLCLDVKSHGTGDGTPIQLWGCNGEKNQRFAHLQDGRIRSFETGKCLTVGADANGTPLFISTCDPNNGNQVWVVSQ